jgi:hypothetical protein
MPAKKAPGWVVRDIDVDEDVPDELICHTAKVAKATAGGSSRPSRKAGDEKKENP